MKNGGANGWVLANRHPRKRQQTRKIDQGLDVESVDNEEK
jgi:hypothetical protein